MSACRFYVLSQTAVLGPLSPLKSLSSSSQVPPYHQGGGRLRTILDLLCSTPTGQSGAISTGLVAPLFFASAEVPGESGHPAIGQLSQQPNGESNEKGSSLSPELRPKPMLRQ